MLLNFFREINMIGYILFAIFVVAANANNAR